MENSYELATGFVVYFVTGHGFTKVGRTNSMRHRIAELRANSPVPLSVVYTTSGNQKLERAVHRVMADRRHHNEWFIGEVTEEEAKKIAEKATKSFRKIKHDEHKKKLEQFNVPIAYTDLLPEYRKVVRHTYGYQQRQDFQRKWIIRMGQNTGVIYAVPA